MKALAITIFLLVISVADAEDGWKTVNEGFQMTVPVSWQKQKVQPIDSNCGAYKADSADLEFDEVFGLGYTVEKAQSSIDEFKKKETNPKLLKPGEEIWHVDGRIAHFTAGNLDPEQYGKRRFSNVAYLFVPYAGQPSYLTISIIYKSDKDLPTARRVLQSIEWNTTKADQMLVTTAQKAVPKEISTNQLFAALDSGLWNSNRTAIAISISQPKASVIFVFLRQTNGTFLAVNASDVEGGNFGKLGLAGREGYDRFETTPTQWLYREDGRFQVVMRTRAWKAGKRYTVSEPLLINPNGTILWR